MNKRRQHSHFFLMQMYNNKNNLPQMGQNETLHTSMFIALKNMHAPVTSTMTIEMGPEDTSPNSFQQYSTNLDD